MSTTRVIIETQSNPLFVGNASEQAFDQRGGLCEVGDGHVVVTTDPIDPDYLNYWKGIGFTLPKLVSVGPFDPHATITGLIARNRRVQDEIREAVNGASARIEPFWVEKGDALLSSILGIPIYSNVELSSKMACRFVFKKFCEQIGLPTAPWVGGHDVKQVLSAYRASRFADKPVLVKASNCTGGVALGTMSYFSSVSDIESREHELEHLMCPLVIEQVLPSVAEVGVHWEITDCGKGEIIGIFDQLSENFSYSGTAFPSTTSNAVKGRILRTLQRRILPNLIKKGGRGFFCCDVLISKRGQIFWTDLNPRKGAILYIVRMVQRLAENQNHKKSPWKVWHKHVHLPHKGATFDQIRRALENMLLPSTTKPFVVLTNPGVIPHGGIDITGLSVQSREEAADTVYKAQELLKNMLS